MSCVRSADTHARSANPVCFAIMEGGLIVTKLIGRSELAVRQWPK